MYPMLKHRIHEYWFLEFIILFTNINNYLKIRIRLIYYGITCMLAGINRRLIPI